MLVWFSSRKIVNILLDIVTQIIQVIWTNKDQLLVMFSLFANVQVSWKSTLQSTFAFSTIEVEYMTITEVAKEAI